MEKSRSSLQSERINQSVNKPIHLILLVAFHLFAKVFTPPWLGFTSDEARSLYCSYGILQYMLHSATLL